MTAMSGNQRSPRGDDEGISHDSRMLLRDTVTGSKFASRSGVRTTLLAALCLPGCLVTEISPEPNQNEPPRILLPGEVSFAGVASTTTDPTIVYFVSPTMVLPEARTVLEIQVDVSDSDDRELEYNIFVTGVAPSTGFDAGTGSGIVTRRVTTETVTTGLSERRASISRTIAGDKYFESVRSCYRVEVRFSSEFESDGYTPVIPGDLATISYWVGSLSSSMDEVDLATCRRQ